MEAVDLRRLTAADLPALSSAVEQARTAGDLAASSDPEAAFVMKTAALDPTIVGGAFAGDDLLGFVSSEYKMVVVRPERRREGIGRRLVDLAEGMERDRGRPNVIIGRRPGDEAALDFLTATGFALHSVLWDLELPAGVEPADPAWPDGIQARTFDRTRDVEAWVALFNTSFADHATPLQLDLAFIRQGLDDTTTVDADTLVVEDESDGRLVGFCATAPIRDDGAVTRHGEIWTIGVLPDRQGAGLGRQLLRWGVGYLRSIGASDVSLSVNGRNERALGLYESEGFARTRTRERWARPVPAAPDGSEGDKADR